MTTPTGAISTRVARLRDADSNATGGEPEFLARMGSGYAVFSDAQPGAIRGCCMLLPDEVVASPNQLTKAARAQFFGDLVLLGDAILEVTGAERINYLVLCNQVPELHGHCIPRFENEDPALRLLGPFEAYDFGDAPIADPRGTDRELVQSLRSTLERLIAAQAS